MEYKMKHGRVLLIVGPQRCGKTTLARNIASRYGSFVETTDQLLEMQLGGLNDLMGGEPRTVICDGLPKTDELRAKLQAMITTGSVWVERKYKTAKKVKTPFFIFCSDEISVMSLIDDKIKYDVYTLRWPKCHAQIVNQAPIL